MAVCWNGLSTASYAGLTYGPVGGKEERKGGKEGKERKEKVAQMHQMVSSSLALLYFSWFLEWEDFLSICTPVRLSSPLGYPV